MKYNLEKYKAVIFDFDDTLVNTIETKWDQHKFTAKKHYNIDLKDAKIREYWGEPFERLLANLYEEKDHVKNISQNYHKYDSKFIKKFLPGAKDLLIKLSNSDQKMGLVTAMTRTSVENDFEYLGFDISKFFVFQGEEDTDYHKPDPRVFEPTLDKLNQLNISPSEVIYIADSIRDYKAASGAGFDFIAVTTGLTNAAKFETKSINYLNKLSELI